MSQTATFMQIDLQNLFFAARNKDRRIDFEKIWEHFHERESEFLVDAVIYMIRSQDFDSSKFEKKLTSIGYNLRVKNSERLNVGKKIIYKQTNHDVNITIECLDRIQNFDKWILMSGDGDFADLCAHLKKKGKQVEVWSFQECYNQSMDPYVDRVHFIEKGFFYRPPDVQLFGFNFKGANR